MRQSEVNGTVNLRECVCYRHSGPMNYRSVPVKLAVHVSLCVFLTVRRNDRFVLCQQMEACIIQSGGSFMLFLFLPHHCS